jgi:hypothetical protein
MRARAEITTKRGVPRIARITMIIVEKPMGVV